ncbi:hypothetical protein, variant 1 [Aphanomyces astaci]|uniref:FYVE-type domain-containing protein n=1 Tax=Aphanomyces astaci TaxID=112090 RepID=W4FJB6_APHAT|nr:hypothetical protein, variant 1 [Aphanomyces astaci]ETV66941.1 hypothetical protein, variant 1 [Aphanomyces astaci]|eukprot:XP_009843582.1 hypothetical protein, variant 1 [Aphanomyces astaci]
MTMDARPIDSVITNPRTRRRARVRKGVDATNPNLEGLTAYTQLRASLSEVATFFDWARLSSSQVKAYARVLGDAVLERQTLYRLVDRPSASTTRGGKVEHSISVEWAVLAAPLGFAARDVVYLDCQDEFIFCEEASGRQRRGWIRAIHSVDVPGYGDLWASHRIRRTHVFRSGHVFVESAQEQGILDYYHVLVAVAPALRMPKVVQLKIMKQHVTQMLHLEEHLMVHRMLLVLDRNHPPAPSSSICGLCDAKFGFFIPRHGVCRSCRQVVCKPCSQVWRSGDTVDGTIMLCLACADTLLDDDRPRGGPVVASGSPPIMGRTTQQQERQDRTETRSREGTFTFLSSTRSMRHTVLDTCAIEDVTAMTKDWKAVGAATKRSCHGTDAAVDRPCQAARAIDPRDLNDALDDVVRFMVALQRGGDFPDNERATTG